MRHFLLALLVLVGGCVASPTTEDDWFLSADALSAEVMDEEEILRHLDYYWFELGVSFNTTGGGRPQVLLYWGDRDADILGECGTGKSCGVNVAAVGNNPEDLAVVISHEMGHSYGLKHSTNGDPFDVMNAQFNRGSKHNWNEEDLEKLRKVINNE